MIEQRKSGNIWAVAILPRSGSILLWDSGKENKQPQQLERERKLAKPLVDSGRFIIFAAETPPSALHLHYFVTHLIARWGFLCTFLGLFWDF